MWARVTGTVIAVLWYVRQYAADEQALVMTVVNPAKQEPLDLHEVEIDEVSHISL
jgi:hypothetical protein